MKALPRVLLVDDDDLVRRVYERVLANIVDVTPASSGEDALDIIYRGMAPDAIVADVSMGGMSGIELYEHLCVVRPDLAARFIAVTGSPPATLDRAFCEALGDRLLFKPVALDEMNAVVAHDSLEGLVLEVARQPHSR
jgi:two-component system, cell cycle sensor histidine kinase and response regulator CckA